MPAIACTSCKRSLTVAENLVGKSIKCPWCAATFVAAVHGASSNGTTSSVAAPPSVPAAASVTLACNQCKKPLSIPETLLGKGVKCPQCAAVFTAQAPVKTTAAQAPKPTGATVPPPGDKPPSVAAKSVTLPCNQCKKPLTIPETLLGKGVKCPQCAAVFTAQAPGKPVAPPVLAGGKPPSPTPAAPHVPTAPPPALVNLACEACKKPIRLPEKLIGSGVKCPHCAGVFTAKKPGSPAPSAAPPAATRPTPPAPPVAAPKPTAPTPAAAKPPTPPPAPARSPMAPPTVAASRPPAPPASAPKAPAAASGEPKVTIHCVRCKRPLRLPETALGKPLRCPRCRMIFAAKPKPPDAASWINYPLEKSDSPSGKLSPSAPNSAEPPASPDKVVRIEPLAAAPIPPPPPLETPSMPAFEEAASLEPVAPDEGTDWESATARGLEEANPSAQMPVSHEEREPMAETPAEPVVDEIFAPRDAPSTGVSTESAEDVFAAHMPKKKKKTPPPPPIEEPPPEPEYAAESGQAEPIPFAPENAAGEAPVEEAPAEEVEAEAYEMAEREAPQETSPKATDANSGGSAAKWFAVGIFLGGLSAAGVGALVVFHVV